MKNMRLMLLALTAPYVDLDPNPRIGRMRRFAGAILTSLLVAGFLVTSPVFAGTFITGAILSIHRALVGRII